MKNKSGKNTDRRSFLATIGAGGASAILIPVNAIVGDQHNNEEELNDAPLKDHPKRKYNGAYTGQYLNRIAFPMGGIGAGMICMEGSGALSHISIRNKPDIFNEPGLFAAISIKGMKNGAKILEGPVPDWKKFGLKEAGNGLGGATTGLPHFREASFLTRFPFSYLDLHDTDLPLKIKITGWSPFIPTDDDHSSMPVASMEYSFTNIGKSSIDGVFSFNAKNFLKYDGGQNAILPSKN
ncbi:MAG: GH116 family glycosyl-hydrolase [Saprospiraceae bacterium]